MSTSYIINLTAEGENNDIQSFIQQLFQGQNGFTTEVLSGFLKTKIDFNWSKENDNSYKVADHLFEGSAVNGKYRRILLVSNGALPDYECENFVFYVWWLSLYFPKLRFRFYGDDCYYSAFINVYQCGFWLAYSVLAGDDYFDFSIDEEEDEFKFDSDAIKNQLDQLFNDGLIIDKAALNAITFIKQSNYDTDMSERAVIDSLRFNPKSMTNALRLAALVFNLYENVYSIAEKALAEKNDFTSLNGLSVSTHLTQPIFEFIERLKSLS